jgi:hypothetical protein
MKNIFTVSIILTFMLCCSQPKQDIVETDKIQNSDLGCKDGGACLSDHSCCIPESNKGDSL